MAYIPDKIQLQDTVYKMVQKVNSGLEQLRKTDDTAEELRVAVSDIQTSLSNLQTSVFDSIDDAVATSKSYTDTKTEETYNESKYYTDQQIQLVTETGIPKLVRYEYTLYPTTENQTTFEIPLDIFDAETDSEVVVKNTVTLDPNEDYTIEGKNIVLNEPVPLNTRLTVFIYKNVPIGEEGAINGAVLANGTIAFEKLDEATKNLINNFMSHSEDYVKHTAYAVASGSANAYSVTLNPAPTSYIEGMGVTVKIHTDNTGASTININGLGTKAIKKANGNDVSSGSLKAGSIYTMRYNGSHFVLQGEGGGVEDSDSTISLQKNFLELLTLRELEGLSTGADAGYWWDLLLDSSKIFSNNGLILGQESGQGGVLHFDTGALEGEVKWKPHFVGFVTDGARYFQERDISVINTVVESASAGSTSIKVDKYSVTMKEV